MSNESIYNCDGVRDRLALLLYGELSFDEEERVELHVDSCANCRAALARQKAVHAAIDSVEVTASPALLARCREEFFETLHMQESALSHAVGAHASEREPERDAAGESWWSQFLSSFDLKWNAHWNTTWMRPAGALALLAIGFIAARLTPTSFLNGGAGANYSAMDLAHLGPDQIRNVQADASGRVNIVINQNTQRTVSGNLQDAMIRNLLVAAAKQSSDPGLRAETVTILVNGAGLADVRDALVFALENDQNTVVRWRAMEGLKSYTHDPSVQTALAQVLLQDMNPGMRTQAIDLLTPETGPAMNRQVVGVLQQMVSREDDAYVRQRAQKMLEAVRASAGVY
jgi:hypothetical protein